MNKKITPYIYILFFGFFFGKIYCQENSNYTLKIKSKKIEENNLINNINYLNKFDNIKDLNKTKDSVLNLLKEKGYYSLVIENLNRQKNNFIYFLKLGPKTKNAFIKIKSGDKEILDALNLTTKNSFLIFEIEKLKPFLNSVSNYLVNNGQLFSKVKLINSQIKNQSLYTELQIISSKKRTINKTILNGYLDFPKTFLKHYLNLEAKDQLNEERIEEISKKISRLNFVSEIKKPEILFSKDSTILYLYLNKKKSNSFDGLINFSTENKKINFRGYLDLNLNNIFNKGEELIINWKNNSNNKQDLTLRSKIPYLFKSKISSEFSFNLYRNDSTFSNTNTKFSLSYPISSSTSISLLLASENSNSNTTVNNISSFEKKMIGLGVNYQSEKSNQFNIDFNLSYGTRATDVNTNQYLLHLNTSGLIKTSSKTQLFLRNKNGVLVSDSYLENELFREGGTSSIRGFNEQSIIASKYSFVNSEFRLLSKNKSYLYSIQDLGLFYSNQKNNILYSLGAGYNYIKGVNSIDISYIYGNSTKATTSFNSSILSIKLITLF